MTLIGKILHLIPFKNKVSDCVVPGTVDTGDGSGGGGSTPNISFSDTGSAVNKYLHGSSIENSFFNANSGQEYSLRDEPFFTNLNSLNFSLLSFPGTPPQHYITYLQDDNTENTPVGNGGFNCTECQNSNSHCCTSYSTSFFPQFINVCAELDNVPEVILGTNPNRYNGTTFDSAIQYAESQTSGLFGVLLAQEFGLTYVQCPICGNASTVKANCTAIVNDLIGSYPDIKYISDWNDINPLMTGVERPYGTSMKQIPDTTSFRMYAFQNKLVQFSNGQTFDFYKNQIDVAIDISLIDRFNDFTTNTGKKISITSYFSQEAGTPTNGTFLSLYFLSRYKVKEMIWDAQNSNKIECSLLGRLDTINARGTLNFNGKFLMLYKDLIDVNNNVFTMSSTYGNIYGVGSIDPNTGSGKAIIINPNSTELTDTEISVSGETKTILSTSWIKSVNLASQVFNYGTEGIPPYSVTLITF